MPTDATTVAYLLVLSHWLEVAQNESLLDLARQRVHAVRADDIGSKLRPAAVAAVIACIQHRQHGSATIRTDGS